jgi:hypothetical protein
MLEQRYDIYRNKSEIQACNLNICVISLTMMGKIEITVAVISPFQHFKAEYWNISSEKARFESLPVSS